MPKIYSYDLKISIVKFNKSNYWDINEATNIFSVCKSSIYNWINMYKLNMLQIKSNIRPIYESKITNEIKKYVIMYVTKRITFNKKNLNRCIKHIFNKTISMSSIYKILKENNLSYKRIGKKIIPINRNIENQIINLKKEVKKYDSNKIVSIDETSFDTHIRATYGWSKKGERIKKVINTPIRKRKTLTLAITKNGILGYNIINNSSNTINFHKFLKENILPKIKNGVILMDNVRFHHSKIVKECVEETTNKILYNIAYNPDTNPIENCFSIIKKVVGNKEPTNEVQLIKEIVKSFKYVTKEKCKAFYKHSLNI
jgi:transposase